MGTWNITLGRQLQLYLLSAIVDDQPEKADLSILNMEVGFKVVALLSNLQSMGIQFPYIHIEKQPNRLFIQIIGDIDIPLAGRNT